MDGRFAIINTRTRARTEKHTISEMAIFRAGHRKPSLTVSVSGPETPSLLTATPSRAVIGDAIARRHPSMPAPCDLMRHFNDGTSANRDF